MTDARLDQFVDFRIAVTRFAQDRAAVFPEFGRRSGHFRRRERKSDRQARHQSRSLALKRHFGKLAERGHLRIRHHGLGILHGIGRNVVPVE